MGGLTQETDLINVMCVVRVLEKQTTSLHMRKHTLGTDLTNVKCAVRVSVIQMCLLIISRLILVTNLSSVMFVAGVLID